MTIWAALEYTGELIYEPTAESREYDYHLYMTGPKFISPTGMSWNIEIEIMYSDWIIQYRSTARTRETRLGLSTTCRSQKPIPVLRYGWSMGSIVSVFLQVCLFPILIMSFLANGRYLCSSRHEGGDGGGIRLWLRVLQGCEWDRRGWVRTIRPLACIPIASDENLPTYALTLVQFECLVLCVWPLASQFGVVRPRDASATMRPTNCGVDLKSKEFERTPASTCAMICGTRRISCCSVWQDR